jgi:hypothetical protein
MRVLFRVSPANLVTIPALGLSNVNFAFGVIVYMPVAVDIGAVPVKSGKAAVVNPF